ncbi:MAG: PQQ-binding-like beta-propeller repeat protein, partial [Vicinamibacterales bacterium]|nr:PQQ-binding-like beta-propeller repeat protein [Vicinamibacterales bacterium]
NLPIQWGEADGIAWKVPVAGLGWSSPVVAGGRVWLTTSSGSRDASLRLMAFDAATGRQVLDTEVFRIPNAQLLNAKNSLASPTPIVDGDRVYVHFGSEGTAAVSLRGEVLWKTALAYETQHGNGGSPVLHRDLLIVNCDGFDQAYVVALDTRTGKPRWKTSRRRPWSQAYSTPLVVRSGDRDLLISVGAFRTVAYDPLTGGEVWQVSYGDGFSNVPRPVAGHGLVYLATGFQQPSLMAVRLGGTGDVTKTHVAWTLSRGAPHTPSPVLAGDELYFVTDAGVASCVDARTGRVLWQQRMNGNFSASPVAADGRVYFQSEEGETTVIASGPAFRRLAVNALDGAMLASLAVSGGAIFIRTDTHLYRINR